MISSKPKIEETDLKCYHCGDVCKSDDIKINDKIFCCNGCKTVYELLEANNLCNYYDYSDTPGINRNKNIKRNYEFLEDEDLKKQLIDFTNGKVTTITFNIPQMHCSSCIWILENLYKLDRGIGFSEVNFLKKELNLKFYEEKTSLRKVVELLDSIGYEPKLSLDEKDEETHSLNKKLYYRIGVAGFCFGNIMLLSFPEYLSIDTSESNGLRMLFNYFSVLLSLPIFFYSAREYFDSALKGLRKKIVNIDVPISLGIAVLFFRSIIDVFFQTGPGYFDSLAGLVFFLLIGKLFQNKTYDTLNFERNYKSFFPISVRVFKNKKETTIPLSKLKTGKRIIIKNGEIIPADSVLIKGSAHIDYSFVTGESTPTHLNNGDIIYAGGRQEGGIIEAETIKEVSQSYLTQLWNHKNFNKEKEDKITYAANSVAKYFTFIVLGIALITGAYWMIYDSSVAFNAFTAVLIVACPCALALATPFTLGSALRIFGKNKFYLKNTNIIEKLTHIKSIVFDKTGTITETGNSKATFTGEKLSAYEKSLIKSLTANSSHPLSGSINEIYKEFEKFEVLDFSEIPGKGIRGMINGEIVKLGSKEFAVNAKPAETNDFERTKVYLSINDSYKGFFTINNVYRDGLHSLINELEKDYSLSLLSGDNEGEKNKLLKIFNKESELKFRQSPFDKLNFVKDLQKNDKPVLMIGDGLNDAGALKQSDVGISIAENINNFSPACDGILESDNFNKLKEFISFAKTSKKVIIISFILSFLYNVIGLGFAVQGLLSPLVAAILMPLSSISVVVFTTTAINFLAKKRRLI